MAIILSSFILFFYHLYFSPEKPPPKKDKMTQEKRVEREFKKERVFPHQEPSLEKKVVVMTELYTAIFTTKGARLKHWSLKRYKDKIGSGAKPVDLLKGIPIAEPAFSSPHLDYPLEEVFQTDREYLHLTGGQKEKIRFSWSSEDIQIIKELTFFGNEYKVDGNLKIVNLSHQNIKGKANVLWNHSVPKKNPEKEEAFSNFVFSIDRNLSKKSLSAIKEDNYSGMADWIGLENKYFLSAIVFKEPWPSGMGLSKISEDSVSAQIEGPSFTLSPQREAISQYSLYLGPKDLAILKRVGIGLERVIDFGWVNIIAKPLLITLKYFYRFSGNFGLAIILLTIIIKIIFHPLSHRSYKSMADTQKIQPLMLKLKEKYKNDKERLNKELMELYRSRKLNPLGGCLPLLLQIPVFFALYRVLSDSIELRHAPFVFWIRDLSAKDPYYITPLLMGASMIIQQRLTPATGDPTQRRMMLLMPIVFTVMFLHFPSGLVIYWLVNNILSITEQLYFINRGNVKSFMKKGS